jgi:hypothetical protein
LVSFFFFFLRLLILLPLLFEVSIVSSFYIPNSST